MHIVNSSGTEKKRWCKLVYRIRDASLELTTSKREKEREILSPRRRFKRKC